MPGLRQGGGRHVQELSLPGDATAMRDRFALALLIVVELAGVRSVVAGEDHAAHEVIATGAAVPGESLYQLTLPLTIQDESDTEPDTATYCVSGDKSTVAVPTDSGVTLTWVAERQ